MSRLFGESVPRKSQRQENVPSHIFTPRSYQVEILDTALRRNTIVCLGSSTGKAFIATMLIKSLAHQIRPPRSQGGKRTVFLANTRDVVQHQAGVFTRETDLSIGRFVKVSSVGRRDTERWNRELDKYHVLAMTPRVLLEMFAHGHLTFSDINLIIFDECEQVNTKHPYAEVMAAYIALNLPDPPRILGLTASVLSDGVATPEELEKKIKRLELSLNSTAETSTDMIVADLYGAKPREVVLQCAGYEDQTGLVARIEEVLQAGLGFLQDTNMTWGGEGENTEDPKVIPRIVYTECLNILRLLGPWCAGRVAQAFCKQLYKLEDVETDPKHKRFLQMTHTSLQMIHTMVDYDYENVVQCLEDFLKYMSPKVLKLFDTLRSYKPDDNFMIVGGDDFSDMDFGGDASDDSMDLTDEEEESGDGGRRDRGGTKPQVHYVAMKRTVTGENGCALEKPADDGLCGLIFVERRHTAFALNKLIQEMCNWDADLYFIQSCHITGKSNHKPGAAVREAEVVYRKQEEVLRQFRNKEVNLLVSTSVLEEGVDVPRCNLVFRFDSPTDYRSYVQSKGRARAPRSTFFMLVDDPNLQAFTKNLDIFKGIENILLGRCQCQEELREEAVDIAHADQLLPPYVPAAASPGVRVTMSTAILLVNRYCAKLPSDAFTHLTPKCTTVSHRVGDTNQYVATLQLPINSPIKEPITGEPMSNKRYAKMAVALQTCEILHRKGELDDNLLPVGKEVIRYEDEEGEWEETQGQARPGTTKRKQYYYKKPADAILGHPPLGEKCYLYMVRMILTCPITEEQNTRGRKIHDPEETPRGFGILSKRKIPLVPRFPVFTRSGEVTTSIDLVSEDMAIGESEYTRLKHFHHKVFTHVLRLEKDPMKFDLDNAVTGYIVVPLARSEAESFSIDWDFIATVEQAPLNNNRKMIFEKEREGFAFDRKVFEDAVVMPSYRNIDQPQYFYVAEIRHDLNPRSPFPSPELYDTFEHYYASKYSLEMTNLDQPLLDVDHTSARLNLLTPRYMNQKGVALPTSSAETRRARRENLQQKQILVPELCDVHPFPASLWRKAVCLPAIFYRMNCLLIADEIRMMIAQGAHIGVVNLPDDFRFQQLEFGFSTKPSDAIQEGKDPAPDPGGSDNENSDQGSREELAQVADKSSDEQSTASDEEKEGSDQGTDQDGEDGNSNDQEKSLSADEEMPSECADLIKTEPADKVKQSIKKEICSPSKPTNYEVCPESKPQSIIDNLTSECNGVNLSDSQTKTTSLVETNSCSNKSNRPQDLIKTEQMIPNGPVPIDCNCTEETEINGLSAKPCKSEIKEESVTEAVPLDSPLFIDTTPTSCPPGMVGAESVTQEEGTFHTPRLNLQDLVTGPSSSTSVCSYHTADTSLTPGSSPAHTAHSSPPNTADTSLTPGSSPAHTAHSSPPHTADTSLTPGSSPAHTAHSSPPNTADTSLTSGSSPAHTAHSSPPHTADTSLTPGSSPSHTKHSTPPHTANTSLTPGSSPAHTAHSSPPHTADTSLTPGSSPSHTKHSTPPHTADTSLSLGSSPSHTKHSTPPHTADTSLTPGSSPAHTKHSTPPHTADTSLTPGSSPAHTKHSTPPHTADTSLSLGSSPMHTKHSTPPHTADTSLTPGSSPSHTKHSTLPHTANTSLSPGSSPAHTKHFSPPQEDRISTSQNSLPSTSDESPTPLANHHSNWPDLDTSLPSSDQTTGVSPSSQPTGQTTDQPTSSNKACHCEAVQQCIDNTDTDFSHVGKESKDCDMDRRREAKDGVTDSCLCSRNGTIKVAKCPRCAEQCACELETAAIPKVSPIVDDKPTQEPQALTEHPEDSLQESETVCNHVSTDSEQKPGSEVENSDLEKDGKEEVLPHGQNEDTTEDQSEPSANTKLGKMDSLCDFDSDLSSDSDSEVSVEPEEEEEKKEEEEVVRPVITFDQQVDLDTFIGPSPCVILQTMTMSNANDFFNLERLETIGDSFLKFAITVYLYCTYPGIHEGKLSYLRSKQVSNYNLYKLGKKKGFPDCMVAAKFEPTENWLPPGFIIKTSNAYKGINVVIASSQNKYGAQQSESGEGVANSEDGGRAQGLTPEEKFRAELEEATRPEECDKTEDGGGSGVRTLIPYNLQTQHSLPDKSIADCVEALIGCYLTTCGQRAALQFMSWLGLKVLPELNPASGPAPSTNCNILLTTINRPAVKGTGQGGAGSASGFGHLQAPNSPLLTHVPHASDILHHHLDGYESFERRIQYTFRDRAYLLQAFTHASYHYNNITDCYQRLEFLGDAILDYVITRHLFEDVKKHSPGILTDLRSALVNNNIFAALAVKWEFHKYFKAISPQLFNVIEKFVARQKEKHDEISLDEEFDEGEEEKGQETEDIEIPKALGDIFESVAGAIYLDSGMSLDTVWRVYYRMMKPQIDMFTAKIPKSPVRELLELEPETAKFEKPERTLDGKIRVMVNVVGKGEFRGIGRNYRIAKSAAAKRALKMIRLMDEQMTHQQLSLQYGIPQFTHHHFAGLGGGRM